MPYYPQMRPDGVWTYQQIHPVNGPPMFAPVGNPWMEAGGQTVLTRGGGGGYHYCDRPHVYEADSCSQAQNDQYYLRKISRDSGFSDYSDRYNSAKSSMVSNASDALYEFEGEDAASIQKEDEGPYTVPDDELCEKIVVQVEFYFSDANIMKDKFLLKHVRRNKEGFVSLKLISSFKRVKHLTKDWRQVAEAIERKSAKLEVNDLKTKVRRLHPLPEYDETTPSRTVVALNLPMKRPTIEGVAEIFSECGEIVLVRILRPGNPIPADVKPFANKHPEITAKVCALIEFERTEFAHKAVKELNKKEGETAAEGTEEEHMVVMELTAPPQKTAKNKEEKRKTSFNVHRQPTHRVSLTYGVPLPGRTVFDGDFQPLRHAGMHQSAMSGNNRRRKVALYNSNAVFPVAGPERMIPAPRSLSMQLNPNAPTFEMHSGPQGPMVRRISATSGVAASGLSLPPNVARAPKGPEGESKGFQRWCRNRKLSAPAAPNLTKPRPRAIPVVAPPEAEDKAPEVAEQKPSLDEPVEAAAAAAAPVAAAADSDDASDDAIDAGFDEEDDEEGEISQQMQGMRFSSKDHERSR